MSPQLLAQGWSYSKVRERHLRTAEGLASSGLQWRDAEVIDYPRVAALVREHVAGIAPDWTVDEDSGALVVAGGDGAIAAALVVSAAQFGSDLVAIVRSLIVDPAWRGKGVGTVTLGMLPQWLAGRSPGRPPDWTIGNCEPPAARYYQRLGFTVLQPGEALDLPFQHRVPGGLSSSHYPCWIFRPR